MKIQNSKFGECDWRSIKSTTIYGIIVFCTLYTTNTELINKFINDTVGETFANTIIIILGILSRKILTDYNK